MQSSVKGAEGSLSEGDPVLVVREDRVLNEEEHGHAYYLSKPIFSSVKVITLCNL